MRRTFVTVAVAAIVVAGCGGGGGSKSSSSSAAAAAGGGSVKLTGSFCGDSTAAQQQGLSPGSDPASLRKDADLLKKFADEAPSAIKADANTIATAYSQIINALASANNDPTKMAAALAPLQGEQAALKAASDRITAYVTTHCHG